jgi:hypothetical protein
MKTINQEVIEYFESLGYQCDWDRCGGQKYHEILKDGELVAQIDMGIPLQAIKEDLIHIRDTGSDCGVSEYIYNINGDGKPFNELMNKIIL